MPSRVGYISFVIAVIAIFLTVIIFAIQMRTGATKENQEKILRKLAAMEEKFPHKITPVMTREDAERPLSIEQKNLLDEYENLKRAAEQAKITAQLGLNSQLSYAGALLREARYKEAESAYRTVIYGYPDNTSAMAGLGITLFELAKYQEAEKIFQRALTIDQSIDPNSDDDARTHFITS